MLQTQLNRAVSRATGEDFDVILCRGFSLVDECCPLRDEDLDSLILDWKDVEAEQSNAKVRDRLKGASLQRARAPRILKTSAARGRLSLTDGSRLTPNTAQ